MLAVLAVIITMVSFFSGPTWASEVALQHKPPAAEPPAANEGGRGWSRQGQQMMLFDDDESKLWYMEQETNLVNFFLLYP